LQAPHLFSITFKDLEECQFFEHLQGKVATLYTTLSHLTLTLRDPSWWWVYHTNLQLTDVRYTAIVAVLRPFIQDSPGGPAPEL